MKPIFRVVLIFCALALLLAAPGCDGGPRGALYGKWQQDMVADSQLPVYWEFTSGGELVFTSGEAALRLNYAFLDDDTIEIEESLVSNLGGVPITWKVEGDKLTLWLDEGSGTPATFSRVR